MTRVLVRVPVRVDLAGGTLDLWPIYLFHPGARTVNFAVSFRAEVEVEETADAGFELELTDTGYRRSYASQSELQADPDATLIARAVEHFGLRGLKIVTRTEAPRGSGLGGSSALTVALVRALSELSGDPVEGDELITLVRDLETRLLGLPAGVQDYYPAVYGGLASLLLDPGKIRRNPIGLPLGELARHLVVHYSGVSHFSGTNNWQMYKRHVEKDARVTDGMSRIAAAAVRMERALESRDMPAAGEALVEEWTSRKALIRGISNKEIDSAITAARSAGAWGGKVCGAGGGGCIVFLVDPDRRDEVIAALASQPGQTLDIHPVAGGLSIESGSDSPLVHGRRNRAGAPSRDEIEQLYLNSDDSGSYRPFVLVEASVTWDEPRFSVHEKLERSLLAPIDVEGESVDWTAAVPADLGQLDVQQSPAEGRRHPQARNATGVISAAASSREGLIDHLCSVERLTIWQNAPFALFSDVGESRDEFLERCLQEARRRVGERSDRLESTYRRRLDQMKEKSEKDQREQKAREEEDSDMKVPELSISWGQTLHKLTSGRSPLTSEPSTPGDADVAVKISQLQKSWDREYEAIRDELDAQARNIEELRLTPTPRNVEIDRLLVIWASRFEPKG
jgi:D-glycero-alpha-D-manno-heptose-7-phosphate kinase